MDAAEKKRRKRSGVFWFLTSLVSLFVVGVVVNTVWSLADPGGYQRMIVEQRAQNDRRAAQEEERENALRAVNVRSLQAERQSGSHCLSSLSGSNRSTIRQVKSGLRRPDSFEHVTTRIFGNDNGEHGLWMTYRAENGFGGTNLERIYARVDHDTCEARLLPDGPGSD